MRKTKMGSIIFSGSLSSEKALGKFLWKKTSKWHPIAFLPQRSIMNAQKKSAARIFDTDRYIITRRSRTTCKLVQFFTLSNIWTKQNTGDHAEDHHKRK